MSCNSWTTVSVDCLEGIGGVETIYVMKHSNLDSTGGTNGYTIDTTGHTITNIHLISSAAGTIFQEIQTTPGSSNWVENRQLELANGSQGWEVQLTYAIPLSDATTRYQIDNMVKSKCIVIVKNVDGRYYLLGHRNGGYFVTSGGYSSGTALTDRNGYELMFTSFETHTAYEVSSSIISTVVTSA